MIVTKAQLAKIILKAKFGSAYTPPTGAGTYTDVPIGSFSADWIQGLVDLSIIEGCEANKFCPNEAVTIDSLATLLLAADISQ